VVPRPSKCPGISAGAKQRDRTLGGFDATVGVAQARRREQQPGNDHGRCSRIEAYESRLDQPPSFGGRAFNPITVELAHDLTSQDVVASPKRPGQRRSDVIGLRLDVCKPSSGRFGPTALVGALDECRNPARMPIDAKSAYRVFVTPRGDTRGLFVALTTASGFIVRESQGGRATVSFDYRIVATALGQAGQRMAVTSAALAAPRATLPVLPKMKRVQPLEPPKLP
jgi:hypothetical protein